MYEVTVSRGGEVQTIPLLENPGIRGRISLEGGEWYVVKVSFLR